MVRTIRKDLKRILKSLQNTEKKDIMEEIYKNKKTMLETLPAPASHEMRIPPSMKVETPFAKYAHLANTPRGGEITEKQANARNTLDSQYLQAKQNIQEQTKGKVSTVRPLRLSDIRSPAGLAHYIEQSDDR